MDWLADTEAVLVLTFNDETRAYPVQVMTWHEIVNDTFTHGTAQGGLRGGEAVEGAPV